MNANHKCKYSKCTLGPGGGRKEYYACPHCDASQSWRSMACCREHYSLYIEEVLAARAGGNDVDLLPERTDMNPDEVKSLVNMPLKKAIEITREELKDYAEDIDEIGIPAAVEKINEEIDNKNLQLRKDIYERSFKRN